MSNEFIEFIVQKIILPIESWELVSSERQTCIDLQKSREKPVLVEKSASLSKFKVIQSTVLYQEIINIRCLNSRRFCQVLEHLNVYNVCLHVVVVASVPSVVYFFSSFASHYACTVCFFHRFHIVAVCVGFGPLFFRCCVFNIRSMNTLCVTACSFGLKVE